MDAARFDRWTRAWSIVHSRRGLNRTLVGVTLAGVLGAARIEATGAKKSKKSCPACRTKKQGRCKGHKPDDTNCEGGGKCLNGKCNPPPTCAAFGDFPCTASSCCSLQCCTHPIVPDPFCCSSQPGERCYDDGDCFGEATCVGYRCT